MEEILMLKNVSVFYGEHPVLKDVNMGIRPGRILAVMGPSGSGKDHAPAGAERSFVGRAGGRDEGGDLSSGTGHPHHGPGGAAPEGGAGIPDAPAVSVFHL